MRIKSLLWKLLDLNIFSSPAGLMANRIEAVVKTDRWYINFYAQSHPVIPDGQISRISSGTTGYPNNVVS